MLILTKAIILIYEVLGVNSFNISQYTIQSMNGICSDPATTLSEVVVNSVKGGALLFMRCVALPLI